jgi:DNA-binding SARP family transcriptional activator
MAILELKLLGELAVTQDGKPLPAVKSQKGLALLCYLAMSGKEEKRPFLAALFWPDMPESQALMNLRKTLQRLQPLQPYLHITRETIAFNVEADQWLDVAEFEAGTVASPNISHLQRAITLYQGDFLAGFMLDDAPLFEEWVLGQRARLREMALGALRRLVAHFREEGDLETAVHCARQLLIIEPWHEETHRELMRLLTLSGQRSTALAQYETCRQMLRDELGAAPAATTVQLYERIKVGEFEEIEAPETKGDGLPPHNLPPQLTPFVRRGAELVQLQDLLARPGVHLITILGAGGMGKTRLALALAEQELTSGKGGSATHPYRHGVYFASLARLATADLLPSAIAEAINFHFKEGEDQREQLLRYLSNKAILLVLDNFEHLLAGTNLVDEILQHSPQTKLLITSRVRLNRQSEQLFPVAGMTYPSLNGASEDSSLDLTQFSAVQLFLQRARRVRPDFVLTAIEQPHGTVVRLNGTLVSHHDASSCVAQRVFTCSIAALALLSAQDVPSAAFGAGFDGLTG